jgi:perosamine synthetase
MIPVNEPLVLEKDLEYVTDALKSGWISSEGKYIKMFEAKFAEYLGMKHAITVNNGTNALILALRALDLPKGSEVVIPSHTIISCALACIYSDLIPVFVDSDPETWCIDTKRIEGAITQKTKAIMPVHLFGHAAHLDDILKIAHKYNLLVVEDFAQAIGTEYKGKLCGSFGNINCVSFYANKTITTGEGGMCVTNDDAYAKRLRSLKNLCFVPERRFIHYELGFNFRMTNVQAAIGLAQIERISSHIAKKIWIGKKYAELLKPLEEKGYITLPVEKEWCKNTYWVFGIVLNEKLGMKADHMMKLLFEKGIQTRPFFYPLHLQPVFKNYDWYTDQNLPIAKNISDYGFYFPSGLTLTEANIHSVIETFRGIVNEIQ